MQNCNTATPRQGFKAPPHNVKMSFPEKAIPNTAPNTGNGHAPGSSVKGFSGSGMKAGKV